MSPDEIRTKARELIQERGPMRAKQLGEVMGLPNARSLSMALQWDGRFINDGRKWRLVGQIRS